MRNDSFETETIQYVEEHYNATEVKYMNYKDFYNDSIWLMDCRMSDGYKFGSSTSHPTKIEAFMDMVLSLEELNAKNRKVTKKDETSIPNFTQNQIDKIKLNN
jgi:hypothetical protein